MVKQEKQLFCCIFLLYPGLVPFERAHSAKKMTQNWYDKAKSGIFRNICTSSIFLHLDLFLKMNSNHVEGPQASGCDQPPRCSSLDKQVARDLSQVPCMLQGQVKERSHLAALQKISIQHDSSCYLQNLSSYLHFPSPYPPKWRRTFTIQLRLGKRRFGKLHVWTWKLEMARMGTPFQQHLNLRLTESDHELLPDNNFKCFHLQVTAVWGEGVWGWEMKAGESFSGRFAISLQLCFALTLSMQLHTAFLAFLLSF